MTREEYSEQRDRLSAFEGLEEEYTDALRFQEDLRALMTTDLNPYPITLLLNTDEEKYLMLPATAFSGIYDFIDEYIKRIEKRMSEI